MIKKLIIGIDFDGTCCCHNFPEIGKDIGAVPVLKRLVENGHRLILFTMRSIKPSEWNVVEGGYDVVSGWDNLTPAIQWFKDNNIPLYGVNNNPEQSKWSISPKPYCHLYIDDTALGSPLKYDGFMSNRPFVDWNKAEIMLEELGLI